MASPEDGILRRQCVICKVPGRSIRPVVTRVAIPQLPQDHKRPHMSQQTDAILRRFESMGASRDSDQLDKYGRDHSSFSQPDPLAVVFPRSTDDVVELVRYACEHQIALVPSGGRTGLSGGAVAARQELVVSFEKMNTIIDFDPLAPAVTVQAGVITATLQEYARQQGLFFPVDYASSGSSQIGGNVATNAGGIKVLRYGLTRDWVLGMTVVTGQGEVLTLNNALIKNATGLDLRHLMIGSEGTLGLITEVTLGLTSPPPQQAVMVLGCPDMDQVMALFARARSTLTLSAYEFFSDRALQHVLDGGASQPPFDERTPYYALIEFDCVDEADQDRALAVFSDSLEAGEVVDGVISQSDTQAAELWALREHISERISGHSPHKNDIAVRVARLPEFLRRLDALLQAHYPQFEVIWFGHIGDGNLHLNILKPADWSVEAFRAETAGINAQVYGLVREYQGSISAEHGLGLLKKDHLADSRSEAEIELMRQIRRLFDPDGILNPGKMLPERP